MRILAVFLVCIFLLSACRAQKFPVTPIPVPTTVHISHEPHGDSLLLNITNRLKSPIQVRITAAEDPVREQLSAFTPVILEAEKDTVLTLDINPIHFPELVFKAEFGDTGRELSFDDIALPVPKNKKIRIIQGHNGSYSHDHDSSRYAIDFAMKINDTIFSASDGFVVMAVDGYKHGGKDIRYLDYANKVIIYSPEHGLFFVYSHLVHQGALVKYGDRVEQGQPVGLVGMTGYTDVPHLHFNVSAPGSSGEGLISVPVDFVEGYKGQDLQKNVWIHHP